MLVELEAQPNSSHKFPDLCTIPTTFIAWRTKAESWNTVVRQVIAVCERPDASSCLARHTVTGELYDQTDLWHLQQMSCPLTMLGPCAFEEW